jgi:hypothetical protein
MKEALLSCWWIQKETHGKAYSLVTSMILSGRIQVTLRASGSFTFKTIRHHFSPVGIFQRALSPAEPSSRARDFG